MTVLKTNAHNPSSSNTGVCPGSTGFGMVSRGGSCPVLNHARTSGKWLVGMRSLDFLYRLIESYPWLASCLLFLGVGHRSPTPAVAGSKLEPVSVCSGPSYHALYLWLGEGGLDPWGHGGL